MTTRKTEIDFLKKKSQATVIIVGNQKGGVGKTTNSYLIGYTLAKWGVKTLVCDLDPQANITKALTLTKSNNDEEVMKFNKTLMRGIQDGNIEDLPMKILDNLYLLPSWTDFQDFPKYLYQNTKTLEEQVFFLKPLFEPLKKEYDIILIDVPPMNPEVTENVVTFSDYVLISLQTQDDSLTGAIDYINKLLELTQKYNLSLEILGFLPMLTNRRGSVDELIIDAAKQKYGDDNIFKEVVPLMERIKRFPITGITNRNKWDKKVLNKYEKVSKEVLDRLYEFEN